MGRWSTTIMGGDSPLDLEGMIYDHLNIEMFPEDSDDKTEFPKDLLEEKQDELAELVSDEDEGAMVLAVVMMRVGARINKNNRKNAISEAKNDAWSKEDDERKGHTQQFIAVLKAYDDKTPTDIDSEGLFDKIFSV